MKIAVAFEAAPRAGGGFQQALNAVLLMRERGASIHELVYLVTDECAKRELARRGIDAHLLTFSRKSRLLTRMRRSIRFNHLLTRLGMDNPLDREMDKLGVDLLYFTGPSRLALMLERTNYIFTVWDLCHRDWVEFPEVRNHLAFEARELLFREALPKATAVLVDSELGRENVNRRYGTDFGRIHILPFAPASHLTSEEKNDSSTGAIREKYKLREHLLYYPAQFWPHKNHLYVIEGISSLRKEHGMEISAVFSGSDGGNLINVQTMAQKAGVDDLVHFPGFVSEEDLSSLYKEALALVMPTYFGPTNLPPLEAFRAGTPVLYSDLPGMREQVGDAAILLDLDDPTSLVDAVRALVDQPSLTQRLIQAGMNRLATLSDDDSRWETLRTIFASFETKLRLWKSPTG